MLRRLAAEYYLVKDNSMKYFFIIITFLAVLSAKAQIPIWQHTPVVPSTNWTLLQKSPTGMPLFSMENIGSLFLWNNKNNSWELYYQKSDECANSSEPFITIFNELIITSTACISGNKNTPQIQYRDTNGMWLPFPILDTVASLQNSDTNCETIWPAYHQGSDKKLYTYFNLLKKVKHSTFPDIFGWKFIQKMVYSKSDIKSPWKLEAIIYRDFPSKSILHVKNKDTMYFSYQDTVFVYEKGKIRFLPPFGIDSDVLFEYHDGKMYGLRGATLYCYEDSLWRKVFSQPVRRYLVINNQEIYCSTLGSRSWDYARGGSPFGDSLYKTTDGGKSWTYLSRYFHPYLKAADGYLYGTYFSPRSRLARTNDDGKTIEFIDKGLTYTNEMFSIQAQQDGSILACGPGLWRSTDEGESWHSLGLDSFYVRHAIIDKKGYIHASVGSDSFPQYRARGQVGVRSTDMGKTWELQIHYTWDNAGGFSQSPDGTLYTLFGVYYDTDFTMQSRDDGVTWQPIDRREMVKYKEDPKEYEVYLAGGVPAFLGDSIVILPNPLSRSTDGGRTWQFVRRPKKESRPTYQCTGVLYDPFRKRFIAFVNEGSYYSYTSIDSGKTWQKLSEEWLPPNGGIIRSIIDSVGRIYVYDPPYSSYLLYSDDGGSVWDNKKMIAKGSPRHSAINNMTVSKRGYVYFADRQYGLYRTTERFPPVGVQEEEEIPNTLRIVPNPANTFLSLSGTDNALVFIADMQGSLMYQGYENSIDISRWQTGMYCARIPATGQKALFMVVR